MKKLLISVVATLIFFGCSPSAQREDDAFIFMSNNQVILMGEKVNDAIAKLGTPNDQYSSPSCAFQGDDMVYDFGTYQVTTYDANGTEIFTGVYLLDRQLSTTEGIKIGDSLEDMKRVYGENYTESYGAYTYTKGLTDLSFVVVNNIITSISYLHIVE